MDLLGWLNVGTQTFGGVVVRVLQRGLIVRFNLADLMQLHFF